MSSRAREPLARLAVGLFVAAGVILLASVVVAAAIVVTDEDPRPADRAEATDTGRGAGGEPLDLDEATLEDVAVAFVDAAATGGDPAPYVRDDQVARDAVDALTALAGDDRVTVRLHPTYLDPSSQGDPAGGCQLTGDVTSTCPVEVQRPDLDEPDSSSLVLVFVSATDGPSPEELVAAPPRVVGFEVAAG